jgi:hypothetical protein
MIVNLSSLAFALIFFITSCGKKSGDEGIASPNSPGPEEQDAQGIYKAVLRPLNNQLSGFLPSGSAEIRIEGDRVVVKTLLDDDARVPHLQSIHQGIRCPESSDDKNNDGLIDMEEAYRAAGDVFIPLDADLSSGQAGEGIYPVGSGFTYAETTSLSKLERDAKSRTGQNLNLAGRVVLIHGVEGSTQIPTSVRSGNSLTTQASIPIGCGILKRRQR